jgi:kynurenine formamidase
MSRRFIDLSIALENDVASDPPGFGPKLTYVSHEEGAAQLAGCFPGLEVGQLPEQQGRATELVQISTHNGTHMDAPWHYHATQDAALPEGKRRAMTIDELPLDWCWRPAVRLDFRHLPDGYVVTAREVETELTRVGHQLQSLDIVVINTAAGAAYGSPDYVARGCGMGREATLYLAERGVRIVGTDGWSWDAPFVHTNRRWQETRDPAIIWEGHKAGREFGYFQLEKLHNLELLPATGFEIACFPVKIRAASAGWVRAVGIVNV